MRAVGCRSVNVRVKHFHNEHLVGVLILHVIPHLMVSIMKIPRFPNISLSDMVRTDEVS